MFIRHFAIIGFVVLTTAEVGCKCPSSACVPRTPIAPCAYESTIPNNTPPGLVEMLPDCDREACLLVPLPAPKDTYQLLEAATCQCNAATNANLANLVELERHWARVVIECDTINVRRNLCIERDLLALHAAAARNKAAGSALEAFYQLAGLEARRHYLDMVVAETRRSLDRANRLQEKGLPVDIDRGEIAVSLSQLEDQRLQLDLLRIQLNGQLQKLLVCPLDEHEFFWPQIKWLPDLTPLDAEAQLELGINTRQDIRGLEIMICQLEKHTLPMARGVIGVADGTLGSVEPTDGIIHMIRCFRCSGSEVPVRCKQLALLLTDTEHLATAEIKGAVYEIKLQQQRVVLAREAVQQRRQRLYELTSKRDIDDVAIFELSKARGRLYEAESELIQQVVQLKIARVRLRKAQGMLVVECGLTPKLCLEGCPCGPCCGCEK